MLNLEAGVKRRAKARVAWAWVTERQVPLENENSGQELGLQAQGSLLDTLYRHPPELRVSGSSLRRYLRNDLCWHKDKISHQPLFQGAPSSGSAILENGSPNFASGLPEAW